MELFYSSGLRLAELTGLQLRDLDLKTGQVRVLGKGSKERIVPVGSHGASRRCERWLARARRAGSAGAAGGVCRPQRRGRSGPRAVQLRVAARARAAGPAAAPAPAHVPAFVCDPSA